MKGKITIFAVLGFIVFFAIEAKAFDWQLYETGEGSAFYYDPQSIKRVSKDIVQVREKASWSEKHRQKFNEKVGSENKELSYSISLLEFNCSEKKSNLLSLIQYKQNGVAIESFSYDTPSWDFIIPKSVEEALFNIVCSSR